MHLKFGITFFNSQVFTGNNGLSLAGYHKLLSVEISWRLISFANHLAL